jgi:hypothetical protein
MATIVGSTETQVAPDRRAQPFDIALAAGFCVLAFASLVGMPRALTRIPDGADRFQLLLSCGMIAVLSCIVLAIVLPRVADRISGTLPKTMPNVAVALCAAVGFAILFVATKEFGGWPQFTDSFAEMFQAKLLSVGKFWTAAPERQDLVRIGNTVVDHGRWYSQYPIGNPALLSLGILAGMSWLPGVIVGVLFATGTMAIAYRMGGNALAAITGLLIVASPMVILSSAAVISNATFAALGSCALALMLLRRPSFEQLALAGSLTGLGACVRPLDALILAAVLAIYVLTRPEKQPDRRIALGALAAGTVLGILPLLFANAQTTGNALRFGYTVLWGGGNMPGFGTRGPGIVFGPRQAISNLLFDTALLNVSLLAWAIPVLVVIAAAVVTRVHSLDARWRLLMGYALAHVLVYFFYWNHDFYFGPRFLLPIAPALFVILADAIRRAARWRPARVPAQAALFCKLLLPVQAVAALLAVPTLMHARSPSVATAAAIARAARSANLGDAFVFVNDGWGSRLFGEMWQLGLSAPMAEQLYARVDACTLQHALDAASGKTAAEAEHSVLDATANATRGVPMGKGVEPTLRLPLGPLPPPCQVQLAFDERSYRAPFAPLLWRNDPAGHGATFVRDPGIVSAVHATLPVYRVEVESSNGTYVVRFIALDEGAIKEVRFVN